MVKVKPKFKDKFKAKVKVKGKSKDLIWCQTYTGILNIFITFQILSSVPPLFLLRYL